MLKAIYIQELHMCVYTYMLITLTLPVAQYSKLLDYNSTKNWNSCPANIICFRVSIFCLLVLFVNSLLRVLVVIRSCLT